MTNKKRMIYADDFLKDAEDYVQILNETADFYDIKWLVDAQTTVDAVLVVRCKDCKHFDGKWFCKICGVPSRKPDDFCSYGERK